MRRTLVHLAVAAAALTLTTAPALGERAGSGLRSFQAGLIDTGDTHACAVLDDASVRCWGQNSSGDLGYGNTDHVGDDESPAFAGPVDVGSGRTAKSIVAGSSHTCAVLDDGSVRCWGNSSNGVLGYGNLNTIGDNETPGSVTPVNLGPGRTAVAMSAGFASTCAILDTGSVRCWGFGAHLGNGNTTTIGDNEPAAASGPIDLGAGRTATAITTGASHSCAILDDGAVRCWGEGDFGVLGYGNAVDIGDTETPGSVGPLDLGAGRRAVAISAGNFHTCAILDDGTVRCWGHGGNGKLGYGNTANIGDNEAPGSVGPVDIGAGRTATAIAAGNVQTCALLDNGSVRCWGDGSAALGNQNLNDVGDTETPGSVAPVDIGAGRAAVAITTGGVHTCAVLDNGTARCWGAGTNGILGNGNPGSVGDDEPPSALGPIELGRPVIGRIVDVSLSAAAAVATIPIGGETTVTLTVANAGLDTAEPTIAIGLAGGASLLRGAASTGGFDAGTGTWSPGPIAGGGSAQLVLTVRATEAGPATVAAETLRSDGFDPDSRPGNLVAAEDDHATASFMVTPAAIAPAAKEKPDRLTLKLGKSRDAKAPHTFRVSGRLVLANLKGSLTAACRGNVKLTAKAGRRTLAARTVALKLKDGACEFAGTLTISAKARRRATTASIAASFVGNADLLAVAAKASRARLT